MDKLQLNLDDLKVDSFQANPEQDEDPGTVQGHNPDSWAPDCSDLCPGTDVYCTHYCVVVTSDGCEIEDTDVDCDPAA